MSYPFARILVALAEAEDTSATMDAATALARAFSSRVTVLHARERVVGPRDEVREEESREDARSYGERVKGQLEAAGVSVDLIVESVRPERLGDLIVAQADAIGADLIVIGGHHPHNLRESVFGDIGKSLAHHAHCPVLLMPSVAVEAPLPRPDSRPSAT